MKEEENVYEETTRSEDTTAVEEEKASTVPGKFKDVDALVRAYSSLQAEFTRRSQRLKELEKRTENFEKGAHGGGHSGVEKLRKNAKARQEESKQFDQFMAQTMGVNTQETEQNAFRQNPESPENQPSKELAVEEQNLQDGDTMSAMNDSTAAELTQKGEEKEKRESTFLEDGNNQDSLYEQVCRNEEVRLKIIGEYLTSIGKAGAPLMTGGVGLLATPPQKPRSIADAGNMALLYFKKPKAN